MEMEMEINHNNQNKNSSNEGVVYLHGDLDLTIIEARSLPNMDLVSEHLRRFLSFLTTCASPNHRHHTDDHHSNSKMLLRKKNSKIITSDPYVTVCLAGATVARTRVISNSTNPVWNEHLNVPVAHPVSHIDFYVKDDDVFGADVIGVASVSVRDLMEGKEIEDWFPIVGSNGKPPKPDAAIHVRMRFVSCYRNLNDNCDNGKGGNEMKIMRAVRRSYFPERKGGSVMLYQDAHVREETSLPRIGLDNGGVFEQGRCWEDVCHAILEAHHLVYVIGWSIYHKVRLVREPTRPLPSGGELTLGDLLKYKSQERVRVLLLVWDDKTSHSKFFINTTGVMQTHDEETRKFFKHSSVICVLSPHYADSKLSIFKQQVVGTLYTHHQKCVIVDTQASGNNRKLAVFLGGLDMCDGRYDTPEHRLCRDLDTTFQDDYHNPTFTRWRKARKSQLGRRFRQIRHWHDDALLKVDRISWILSPSPSIPSDDSRLWVCNEDDPESWHVQVFRSIDSGSVKGFPKDVQQAEAQNLVCAKNIVIDGSIQTAYVEAIRSAEHFIYIENQYFLGSSYACPSYKNAGLIHLAASARK